MAKYGIFSGQYFPYLAWIRENTDQKDSLNGHFSRSVKRGSFVSRLHVLESISITHDTFSIFEISVPMWHINPIQDGGGGAKKPPYQIFLSNFYKRRN